VVTTVVSYCGSTVAHLGGIETAPPAPASPYDPRPLFGRPSSNATLTALTPANLHFINGVATASCCFPDYSNLKSRKATHHPSRPCAVRPTTAAARALSPRPCCSALPPCRAGIPKQQMGANMHFSTYVANLFFFFFVCVYRLTPRAFSKPPSYVHHHGRERPTMYCRLDLRTCR